MAADNDVNVEFKLTSRRAFLGRSQRRHRRTRAQADASETVNGGVDLFDGTRQTNGDHRALRITHQSSRPSTAGST
jgi:hypothetical protein